MSDPPPIGSDPSRSSSLSTDSLPHPPSIPPSPVLSFPLNYLHALTRFLILFALLPCHAVLYTILPRSKRPRSSWSLLETVLSFAVKRYLAMIDIAGFKISSRNVFETPRKSFRMWRSRCRFEWIELDQEEVQFVKEIVKDSVADDENVKMREKVGVFSWYRERENKEDPEKFVAKDETGLVGLFFHGGAFTHNSAHPKSQSTVMPLTLFRRSPHFISMHSVEFRLLPEYPFPAQLQDAITVYVGLLKRGIEAKRIVLIGDSSGANIALSLARWIRDTLREKGEMERFEGGEMKWKLGDSGGLILFSPWVDPSHSFLNCTPQDYVPRPNPCDYILETGPFRHHLVHNLLGPSRPRSFVLSPYLSPGRINLPPDTFDPKHSPVFVSYGTGERGQAECERLVNYLKRDGVKQVEVVRTEDTMHDILLLGFWNREKREEIWRGALRFLEGLEGGKMRTTSGRI
ncbi:hypothetical protein JCM3765_005174 [Sporobolomyces pararoseus]